MGPSAIHAARLARLLPLGSLLAVAQRHRLGCGCRGILGASEYADWPGVEGPFRLVAIIMTVVAAGNFLIAILSSSFRDK